MVRTTWICDSCGLERPFTDEEMRSNCTCWELLPGWMTVEKFMDGKPERIEICPACAKKINLG